MLDGTRKRLSGLLVRFVRRESAGGFLVIALELLVFLWGNSPLSPVYFSFSHIGIGVGLGLTRRA